MAGGSDALAHEHAASNEHLTDRRAGAVDEIAALFAEDGADQGPGGRSARSKLTEVPARAR